MSAAVAGVVFDMRRQTRFAGRSYKPGRGRCSISSLRAGRYAQGDVGPGFLMKIESGALSGPVR